MGRTNRNKVRKSPSQSESRTNQKMTLQLYTPNQLVAHVPPPLETLNLPIPRGKIRKGIVLIPRKKNTLYLFLIMIFGWSAGSYVKWYTSSDYYGFVVNILTGLVLFTMMDRVEIDDERLREVNQGLNKPNTIGKDVYMEPYIIIHDYLQLGPKLRNTWEKKSKGSLQAIVYYESHGYIYTLSAMLFLRIAWGFTMEILLWVCIPLLVTSYIQRLKSVENIVRSENYDYIVKRNPILPEDIELIRDVTV